MFKPVFEGVNFSYFHEKETERYMLYWPKYDIYITLENEDASLFRQQLDMINNEPEKDIRARTEKAIKIRFYFRYASPMMYFTEP
jgi:hypothetical protein